MSCEEKDVKRDAVSEMKIDEVLADFFIKKIIKEKKSSHSKKKKHHKRTKHKHKSYSSSSEVDNDKEPKSKRAKHSKSKRNRSNSRSSLERSQKKSSSSSHKNEKIINKSSLDPSENLSKSGNELKDHCQVLDGVVVKEEKPWEESLSKHLKGNSSSTSDHHAKAAHDIKPTIPSIVPVAANSSVLVPSLQELHSDSFISDDTFGCSLPPGNDIKFSLPKTEHDSMKEGIDKFRNEDFKTDADHKSVITETIASNIIPEPSLSSLEVPLPDIQSISDAVNSSSLIKNNKGNKILEKLTKHEELYKDLELAKLKTKPNSSSDQDVNSKEENKQEKRDKSSEFSRRKKHEDRKKHLRKRSGDSSPEYSKESRHSREEKKKDKKRHSKDRSRSRESHHRDRHERKKVRDRHSRGSTPERSHRSDRSRKISQDRHRSRRSRSGSVEKKKFDKVKLLEIARRNAMSLLQTGALPEVFQSEAVKKRVTTTLKSGGKSVEELTEFCTALSKRENMPNDPANEGNADDEQPFIRNPFKLRETSEIKLNIRNSVPIPIESHAEKVAKNVRALSSQFPVSSGNQHRQKELEWIPVEKESDPKPVKVQNSKQTNAPDASKVLNELLQIEGAPPAPPLPPPLPPPPPPPPPPLPVTPFNSVPKPVTSQTAYFVEPSPPPPEERASATVLQNVSSSPPPRDINTIINRRLKAVVRLNQNPNDYDALLELHKSEAQAQSWIQAQQVPGQFTGSTNAKLLSVQELCGPRPAWAKKDTFTSAAPVAEGKGMSLLKKMGWNPGEGLGKNKEGTLVPLSINIKTDKKGFLAQSEGAPQNKPLPVIGDMNKKHPVSVLMELCSKRKWLPPSYSLVLESGPIHRRNFLFKVEVNNCEYKPAVSRPNKKQAKAECALVCLQALGVVAMDYKMV